MHKRGYSRHAVSVRLSVCLSVTFVDHVKTNKNIFEIFSPSGSHSILFFFVPNGVAIFRREPPYRGRRMQMPLWGIGRNRDSGLIAGYRRLLNVRSAKNIWSRDMLFTLSVQSATLQRCTQPASSEQVSAAVSASDNETDNHDQWNSRGSSSDYTIAQSQGKNIQFSHLICH